MSKNIKVDNDTRRGTNEELSSNNMDKYSVEITGAKAFQDFLDEVKKDVFKEKIDEVDEIIKDTKETFIDDYLSGAFENTESPKLEILEIDSKAEVGRSFLTGDSNCIICGNEKIRNIIESQLNKDTKIHILGCDMCQILYKVTTDNLGEVTDFKIIDTDDINIGKNKNKTKTTKKKKKQKKTFGKNKKK